MTPMRTSPTFRKSRYVSLLLAGAAATALASCDQGGTDATLYSDAGACAQDFDQAACESALLAAKDEHLKQAPKFASVAECEAAGLGTCEPAPQTAAAGSTSSSSGMFMPMMMGYMMGRMMGGNGMMGPAGAGAPTAAPAGSASKAAWSGTSRPVYANRDGYLFAGGANVGRVAPGSTSLGSAGIATRTVARGGFGGSASRMGGGS